jgi:hypothetical protein
MSANNFRAIIALGLHGSYFDPAIVRESNASFLKVYRVHKECGLGGLSHLLLGWNKYVDEPHIPKNVIDIRVNDDQLEADTSLTRFVITKKGDWASLPNLSSRTTDLLLHVELDESSNEHWAVAQIEGTSAKVTGSSNALQAVFRSVALDIATANSHALSPFVEFLVRDVFGSLPTFYEAKVAFCRRKGGSDLSICSDQSGYFPISRTHSPGSGYERKSFGCVVARLDQWMEFLCESIRGSNPELAAPGYDAALAALWRTGGIYGHLPKPLRSRIRATGPRPRYFVTRRRGLDIESIGRIESEIDRVQGEQAKTMSDHVGRWWGLLSKSQLLACDHLYQAACDSKLHITPVL